jgi:putative endonuclease
MQSGTAQSASLLTRMWLDVQRRQLLQLTRLAHRLHPPPARTANLVTGERGEFEALFFLRHQGYKVVERRWRSPDLNGDLDLIAWDGATLCAIEVKTRTARDLTPAASAIDESKRNMLRRMARAYVRTLPHQGDASILLRFDIVSVYLLGPTRRLKVECELLKNAFPLNTDLQEPIHPRYGV